MAFVGWHCHFSFSSLAFSLRKLGGGIKEVITKRIHSLIIPYLILCCIAVAWAKFTVGFEFSARNIVVAFGLNFMKNPASGVLWYIRTIVMFVMLIPVFKYIACRKALMLLTLLICGMIEIFIVINGDAASKYLSYNYLSYLGPIWFLVGIYCAVWSIHIPRLTPRQCVVAFAIVCIMMFWYGYVLLGNHHWQAGLLLEAVLPFIFIVGYNMIPQVQWPIILTSCSFPIYVLQSYAKSPVLWIINRSGFLFDVFHKTALGHLMIPMLTCCVAFVMAICVKKVCPKFAHVIFGGR